MLPVAVQWHRVLDRALAENEVVAVADAVAQYLDRTPTRSELTAARRAAHRYAESGEAQLTLLPSVVAGRSKKVLVLTRQGIDLDDFGVLRRSAIAQARKAEVPKGQMTRNTARRAESLLTQVSRASRAARLLPVDQIEPGHARLLSEDLTEALAGLAVFAADLTRRSRQNTPTVQAQTDP